MFVVGGLGTILGSIAGAVVLTWLNLQASSVQTLPLVGAALEAFSQRFMTVSGLPNVTWIITGLVLIFIVTLEPLGLYGLWLRTKIYWRSWPF